jgi:predicted RNA-binding Zn ribbon-like protein
LGKYRLPELPSSEAGQTEHTTSVIAIVATPGEQNERKLTGHATMSGETGDWLMPPSAQPGGRPPAPGSLALVQSFINSHYDLDVDHGADLFATPRTLRKWLMARGLIDGGTRVGRGDLERALAVREGLRKLARGGDEAEISVALELLNEAASGVSVELRFSDGRPQCVPAARDVPSAIGLVLGLTAEAMLDGTWSRLKICPGHDCDWAFFDHSRNQTGRWCSMSVCGGRAKARSHYRRRRGGD